MIIITNDDDDSNLEDSLEKFKKDVFTWMKLPSGN